MHSRRAATRSKATRSPVILPRANRHILHKDSPHIPRRDNQLTRPKPMTFPQGSNETDTT